MRQQTGTTDSEKVETGDAFRLPTDLAFATDYTTSLYSAKVPAT